MMLGLLYKAKKKRALAVQHLTVQNASLPNSAKPRYSHVSRRRSLNWGNKDRATDRVGHSAMHQTADVRRGPNKHPHR
jgi:hypothetical protein